MILAIDTTREFGSLALRANGALIEEVLLHAKDGFGHVIFGQIERLLQKHVIGLDRIECFAAASGPGSFTGVRVGLSCVKGLAEAMQKPAVAVSNLQALATFGTSAARACLIDARRGEIYGAVYDAALEPLAPEVVTKFPAWMASLPAGAQVISMDFAEFRQIQAPRAIAGAVALIAEHRLAAGLASDPAAIDANYVRRSDAELFWKE